LHFLSAAVPESAAPFVVAGVADIDGVLEVRWED
jgi:hypothetical protein